MKLRSIISIIFLALSISSVTHAQLQLNGAGATFPAVIYSKWFDEYKNMTGVQFNYQAIGSGGGIRQVTEGTVDFGATDGPMSDQQLAEAKSKQGSDVLHIPTVMGAVVVSYNLPGVSSKLNLDGETLANIFLGNITKWNDGAIAKMNPKMNLPNKAIVVTHRSDGSGTTFIFTDYLAKVSKNWEGKVGKGTSVNWPVGLGGKGNDGVAGLVKQTEGSIGYVELAYAVKNNIAYANMKNNSGNFVEATFSSVSAAAEGASKNMPSDLRVSITNADGKNSYPISGFTWLLVYKNMKDEAKANALVKFLKWAMGKGQSFATDLYYAPLPKAVVKMCEKNIATITANGKKIK
ncbi:MAG: phosphate ABC transporter substrate-binding protein PstS [Ignavibacteriales bacterium]|nr:phosphate ABC transporter substrate-binding protein PstS [Ignavibacteriales bacterium]